MEAGPELDALVAEKLMGIDLYHCTHTEPFALCEICLFRPDLNFTNRPNVKTPKPYSTEIAAAWEVAMRFNYLYLFCHTDMIGWECKLMPDDEDRFYARNCKSAPHAICLAALKAVDA